MRDHEHYCPEHDHRWHCTVDPCVLPVAWRCDLCRCGRNLVAVNDGLLRVCPTYLTLPAPTDGHDSVVVQTTRYHRKV